MAITRIFSTLTPVALLGWTIPVNAQAEHSQFNTLSAATPEQTSSSTPGIKGPGSHMSAPEAVSGPAAGIDPDAESVAAAPVPEAARPEQNNGWTFAPFGRLMIDAGTVEGPAGIDDPGLGSGATVRRARLGAEGDMPGGFDYKLELEFSGDDVEITDAVVGYDAGDTTLTLGQHNNFQGLEELTSSRFLSFMERAAFTDAFNFQRRVGLSASYTTDSVLAQGGVFTENIHEFDAGEDSWGVDARGVVAPKLGNLQVHVGASVHYRELGGRQSTVRYRQRPHVNFTEIRFVNTRDIGAVSELGYGLEFAAIRGPLHVTGEAFWQQVDRPGALADPKFFGGFAEIGYFLTPGDRRGYKSKKFDRIEPENPVGTGGIGAVQINARYDHLDLNDAGIVGGTQNSFGVSLVWTPTDHTRLMANYWRSEYRDAAIAAGITRDYGVDSFGVRAQFDF